MPPNPSHPEPPSAEMASVKIGRSKSKVTNSNSDEAPQLSPKGHRPNSQASHRFNPRNSTPFVPTGPGYPSQPRNNRRAISRSVDLGVIANLETAENGQPRKTDPAHATMLTNGIKWLAGRSKVFVSIDLEYWEFNNSYLTEIGIAVYDPTNLPKGCWPIFPRIKSCHYVVAENKEKTNGKYVPDNMFKYSYGDTLVMTMADCKQAVNTILRSLAKRNTIVIVGHDVSGDLHLLRKEGFIVPKHELLDTLIIWRITRKLGFGSLSKLLEFFNIPHGLMHNAGNDAHLNMYLFLALCDPQTRLEKKLDEVQAPEEPISSTASLPTPETPQSSSSSQPADGRKRGRRRDLPIDPASRVVDFTEAIKLMF